MYGSEATEADSDGPGGGSGGPGAGSDVGPQGPSATTPFAKGVLVVPTNTGSTGKFFFKKEKLLLKAFF